MEARNTLRDFARLLWENSGRSMPLREIAGLLKVPESTVRVWKHRDDWCTTGRNRSKRKRGGQPGNKNAAGHGAPLWNINAAKYGFYSMIPGSITRQVTEDGYMILSREIPPF